MNENKIANKLAESMIQASIANKIARDLTAFTMTEDEWKEYQKQHPGADRKNHTITPNKKSPAHHEEEKGEHKPEHFVPTKEQLQHSLTKGHYSIISAGRNSNNPDESKLPEDHEMFKKRHEELRKDLEKLGAKYTEVVGHYGGKESSFLVLHDYDQKMLDKQHKKSFVVHHINEEEAKKKIEELNKLGKKYHQDSVLHGNGGRNEIHFTTGKNAGKTCGGKGYEETPDAEDYYTEAELENKKHTKFKLNIDECFEKGLL